MHPQRQWSVNSLERRRGRAPVPAQSWSWQLGVFGGEDDVVAPVRAAHVAAPPELGLQPLCVRRCQRTTLIVANALPQTRQLCGFSSVCVRALCFVKVLPLVNALPQTWHTNGLSPVWVRACTAKLPLAVKALPQTWHTNGLSPVWVRMCAVKLLLSNALPQTYLPTPSKRRLCGDQGLYWYPHPLVHDLIPTYSLTCMPGSKCQSLGNGSSPCS